MRHIDAPGQMTAEQRLSEIAAIQERQRIGFHRARDTGDLLDLWGILHLRNPATTPQNDDSCEAADGSQKKITDDQASLAAHPMCLKLFKGILR